ncbi:outer membrane protein [Afifella sp. IM 167]|uniref:outer membrane protein n=1 Tax=Afifella sp. IM 167 TaxID=2033586 RepID=UPI001CCF4505|nr:outer membrane protein [Afifella sp. IM 167]
MRSTLISTAALALLGSTAMAADLPSYEPAPAAPAAPVSAPGYNWTGGYVGLQGGYGWSNVDSAYSYVTTPAAGSLDFDADGWILGLGAGYDYQWNWAVVGIHGDVSWLDVDGNGSNGVVTNGQEADWMATMTARVGAGMDRFMPYLLGGVAYVDYQNTNSYPAGGLAAKDDDGDFGWTLGGGLEVAVTDNVSISGEYRHYWLDDKRITYGDGSTATFDSDMDTFTVGVNWRFGGPAGGVMGY